MYMCVLCVFVCVCVCMHFVAPITWLIQCLSRRLSSEIFKKWSVNAITWEVGRFVYVCVRVCGGGGGGGGGVGIFTWLPVG